ncbi:DUF4926 domain-containing protein [Caulobacter sp. UNC279MFTsu5.1]|uniref:DUF4926 domain-containing protein n=1 Tax=Caulobacter sp. UNC279MFTsu5.1 TaxID=1502775 RepID=UPI00036FCC03|nr:DUF4926 domain-containing protein [Caulobacter sp. UNC279MFTsu5.1]SFI91376.1 protein of unknown function [Caulobacter sp. UNC279MFTsu5.1]
MLDELDVVALLVDRPDLGLSKGQTGTIVCVYGKREAFEVEFVDDDGFTYGLETFRPEELLKLHFTKAA